MRRNGKFIKYWREIARMSANTGEFINGFAAALKEELRIAFMGASFYEYTTKGVWKELEVDYLKKIIKDVLGEKSARYLINEIMEQLRLASLRYPDELTHPANLINVKNGLLDLNTYGLSPHSHEFFYVNQLPILFNKDAESPKWIKTVNEIFEEDIEKIRLLQELFGYILIPDVREEKAFFFIGAGQNGKGVIIHVLVNVVGKGNYSTVSLSDLNKTFRLIEIKGKLLNVTSETQTKLMLKDDVFKTVVSGEPIMGERKYKQPFQFLPVARWVIAMNNFPKILDRTEGTWRRIIPIEFNRYFTDQERDNNLKHDLVSKELPGILNWALDGLKRYRKQGSLYIPESVRMTAKKYRKESNPIALFVDEHFEIVDTSKTEAIRARSLYSLYRSWCENNGEKPETNTSFAKILMFTFPALGKDRDNKGVLYLGLKPRASV